MRQYAVERKCFSCFPYLVRKLGAYAGKSCRGTWCQLHVRKLCGLSICDLPGWLFFVHGECQNLCQQQMSCGVLISFPGS